MSRRVLIIDDESSVRDAIRMILEYEGYQVHESRSGSDGIERLAAEHFDVVLLDVKMPVLDGMEVLDNLSERGIGVPVVMISGHGDIQTAVEATRKGAWDFLEKPLNRDRLLVAVRNATEQSSLRGENRELKRQQEREQELVGESAEIHTLREQIRKAAPTSATVLIEGESGTGKELVAREIHQLSERRSKPFVQVNCAAIPEELIESELFGHEKGSFTGATRKQTGKFVAADGGTIFLDEVGDMSGRTQAKVLRVLQEGEVEPVGAASVVKVDVRVIAATNKDLRKAIEHGRFRDDLFYRLNVIPIRTPSLRERRDDIPLLADHFAALFAARYAHREKTFTTAAKKALREAPWRGNVRELRNVVERLVIMSPGDEIDATDLPGEMFQLPAEIITGALQINTLQDFKDQAEKSFILAKLREHGWNVSKTAEAIGTPRSNLYKKIDQYGIERE